MDETKPAKADPPASPILEVPQSNVDLTGNANSAAWLVGVAWIASLVSVCYSGVFALGIAMSPGVVRLSGYETTAVGIWPAIVAMAVMTTAKRGTFSRSHFIGFLIPVIMVVPGVFLSMKGLDRVPWVILLIWIPPLIAFVFDVWMAGTGRVGFALEVLLIGTLVFVPIRVFTHGFDFGQTHAQMKRASEDYRNRMMREDYFAELFPFLKNTFRPDLGPWHLVAARSPGEDGLHEWRMENVGFLNPNEAGFRYENGRPLGPSEMAQRVAQQIKETKTQLILAEAEYIKAKKDWKEFSRKSYTREEKMIKRRAHWQIADRKQCLTRQAQWDEARWQKWNERENQVYIQLTFFLPGDDIPDLSTIADFSKLEPLGPDVIVPWSQWPRKGEERSCSNLEFTCVLGESNKAAQAYQEVSGGTYFDPPFSFKSMGMRIKITARNARQAWSFIDQVDREKLKVFLLNPPVAVTRADSR